VSAPRSKAAAPALAAVCFSDRTSLAVVGVPWGAAKRFCKERGVAIHKCGRRSLVRIDAFLAALEGNRAGDVDGYDEDAVVARAAGVRS
jgi:hypothetical protein